MDGIDLNQYIKKFKFKETPTHECVESMIVEQNYVNQNFVMFDTFYGKQFRHLFHNENVSNWNNHFKINKNREYSFVYIDEYSFFGNDLVNVLIKFEKILNDACNGINRIPNIDFFIYFYSITYHAYILFLTYTNHLKEKFSGCVELNIVLQFCDIFYSPIPYYYSKYMEYTTGKNIKNIDEYYHQILQFHFPVMSEHRNAIEIFKKINPINFIEYFRPYFENYVNLTEKNMFLNFYK